MTGALPGRRLRSLAAAWLLALLVVAAPAAAQTLPALQGRRVVDEADLLPPDREAALTAKLESLERSTSRQLVVVTVPGLQGYSVDDFGFRLGETWKIGDKEADNGAILLVALAEKKIRIEVGDGLEPILTDAMSGLIIRDTIRPKFQAGDFPGGIEAGTDAIIEQLRAPPEVAEQKALEAQRRQSESRQGGGGGGSIFPLIFWGIVLVFFILPMLRGGRRGRRYRRNSGVWVWGPGIGGGSDWGGSSWGGSSGGGDFGGFDGGGFSGGGGSFGGGGASGGW